MPRLPHRSPAATAVVWLGAVAAASALSLELDVKMSHDTYVLQEPAMVRLTVRNLGGSPYIVDDYGAHDQNTVRVYLKHSEDGYLTATDEKMPFGSMMVMPNESQTVEINLAGRFPLGKLGRYFLQVSVSRGEEVVTSRLLMFAVVHGIEIGSLTRPLPEYDTIARKYTLLYWARDQIEVLFLRVDETPPGRCVGLIELGNVVRSVDPTIEFDPTGTLTVLHQSSRDLFIRTVIRSDRNTLKVVDRQRLLDPSQSPLARSAMMRQQAATDAEKARKDDFQHRVRPGDEAAPGEEAEEGADPAAKAPRRTLR